MASGRESPSKHYASTTIASVNIDPQAERALVWKFDMRLLPVLAIMYLFNSLDKSNLGNAKTGGLEGEFGVIFVRICANCRVRNAQSSWKSVQPDPQHIFHPLCPDRALPRSSGQEVWP